MHPLPFAKFIFYYFYSLMFGYGFGPTFSLCHTKKEMHSAVYHVMSDLWFVFLFRLISSCKLLNILILFSCVLIVHYYDNYFMYFMILQLQHHTFPRVRRTMSSAGGTLKRGKNRINSWVRHAVPWVSRMQACCCMWCHLVYIQSVVPSCVYLNNQNIYWFCRSQ